MMIKWWAAVSIVAAAVLCVPTSAGAQDVPAEYQQVLSTLGKQGASRFLGIGVLRFE